MNYQYLLNKVLLFMNRKKEKNENAKKRSRIRINILASKHNEIGSNINNTNIFSRILFGAAFLKGLKIFTKSLEFADCTFRISCNANISAV